MYGVQSSKSFLVGHRHVEIIGSSKERNKNSNNISDRTYKQGQSWFDLCLYDLCFIVLCYKGRKDTIVPGGSQFTRYNLSVSLCLKERPKWKIRSDLFCVARYNSSWERVNQPLFVFRPRTEFMSFFSYFNYNSAVFQRNNLTRQIALIQCSGRSKHTLPFHNKL